MSPWVTVSSVPEAHTVKGKNQFLEVVLYSPHSLSVMSVLLHTHAHICTHMHMHTPKKYNIMH